MKVLITGATGFVGGHLCQAFTEAGHSVVAMVREPSEELSSLGVKQVTAFLENPSTLKKALKEAEEPEVIIHNAGLVKAKSLDGYWQVNAIGTFNLLHAIEETDRRPRLLIYISSLAAAGPGRLVREEDEPKPLTPYGASKLYGERFIVASKLPYLIFRPPVIYGPKDKALLPLFRLIKLGFVPRWERHYSLCFVKDLAKACVAGAERALENHTIFVAQGEFSFSEIADTAGEILGKRPRMVPLPQAAINLVGAFGGIARCLFRKAPMLSPEKAKEMKEPAWSCATEIYQKLGLPAAISLEEGFKETINWYREKGLL